MTSYQEGCNHDMSGLGINIHDKMNHEDIEEIQTNRRSLLNSVGLLLLCVACGLLLYSGSLVFDPSGQDNTEFSTNLEDLGSYTITYSSLPKSSKKELFEQFKQQFGRSYESTDEETEKYSNFEDFLKRIDENNAAEAAAGGRAYHGITKFADLSWTEFKSRYLGFDLKGETIEEVLSKAEVGDSYWFESGGKSEESDEIKNWAGTQTTPVKDQGYCGSCWAFSATEQIESDSIKAGYLNTSQPLSVQQMTSCDTYAYGCDGGNPVYGYYYIYKTGGQQLNSTYPYTSYGGTTGTCDSDSKDLEVTVTTYYYMTSEDAMESHVLSYGPLSVCVDATTWVTYTNGTITSCGTDVNHCVQAVGINKPEEYWVIRNSWGTDWGEDGYILVQSGENMCDITYIPTFTNAEKV